MPNTGVETAIRVAVGILTQGDKVFIARRSPGSHQGDKWEFPGGKLEPGEDTFAALQRELRRLPRLRDEETTGSINKFDVWFERMLYMSGWNMTPIEGALLIVLVMLIGGGTALLVSESGLLTLLAATLMTLGVFGVLAVATQRRLAAFESQFPMALDLLARAVRAGESFDQSLALVSEAADEPVGIELRRCTKQLEMGLPLQTCMRGLAQRLDLMDVRIFANAVAVHRDAGGSLPTVLERLAEMIRDRQSCHRQLRIVTGAGRMSALLITALGPILFVYMFVFQPEYGHKLVDDPMGRWMLVGAVVAQVTGIVWVLRLLKNDY